MVEQNQRLVNELTRIREYSPRFKTQITDIDGVTTIAKAKQLLSEQDNELFNDLYNQVNKFAEKLPNDNYIMLPGSITSVLDEFDFFDTRVEAMSDNGLSYYILLAANESIPVTFSDFAKYIVRQDLNAGNVIPFDVLNTRKFTVSDYRNEYKEGLGYVYSFSDNPGQLVHETQVLDDCVMIPNAIYKEIVNKAEKA